MWNRLLQKKLLCYRSAWWDLFIYLFIFTFVRASSKQHTFMYCLCTVVFHLKNGKKIFLSLFLSFPLILPLILIFPSSLPSSCVSNVENAASPLPSPWLFTSPKIKWASLFSSLSLSLSLPNYSTQSHTLKAGFTIIKLILSALTQTLCYLSLVIFSSVSLAWFLWSFKLHRNSVWKVNRYLFLFYFAFTNKSCLMLV